MSVSLDKCGYGCKNLSPEEFEKQRTDRGEKVCNWFAVMWGCDKECCTPRNYWGPSVR